MQKTPLLVAALSLSVLGLHAAHAGPVLLTALADHSFPYGSWAGHSDCGYEVAGWGSNVAANDLVFGSSVAFVLAEDDQAGPIMIQDPVTGTWTCWTNGVIAPDHDLDDCVSPVYVGTGTACGTGGGDGKVHAYCVSSFANPPGGYAHRPCPTTTWTRF